VDAREVETQAYVECCKGKTDSPTSASADFYVSTHCSIFCMQYE